MTNPEPFYINAEVKKQIGQEYNRYASFQSYAGTDIQAVMYIPLINPTGGDISGTSGEKYLVFANLQTLSISSTRSISPVRVLGRSSPIDYTRGARTFAGTLVFASINSDVFEKVYDISVAESTMIAANSMVSDQLPPFSIVIIASNETGGAAMQVIHGITLTNYGTAYSIDDLYTETTYTYVATDVTPLVRNNMAVSRAIWNKTVDSLASSVKSVSNLLEYSLKKAYGSAANYLDAARKKLASTGPQPHVLLPEEMDQLGIGPSSDKNLYHSPRTQSNNY